MGNCHFKQDFEADNLAALTKSNFSYMYCVGKGGFGKVWKVERKKTKQNYAMKEMSKARILTKRSLKSVMNERQILTQLNNPFIVNMYYAFQDRENLYLVMDLLSGGDLRYHICKNRRFTEEQTRFFIACLIAGLEYIHNKNIIHRDIKPENLVLDQDGYLRITDFGIARVWRPENSQDTSGTPGYMAPEVMCRQNHGIQVDYFAVGVMAFECMFGKRPYLGKSRQEIRDHILSKQIQIKKGEVPKGWSLEAADFINKMIQRKPMNRLGKNGPSEVKMHPWLKDFPWQDLWQRKLVAPFIPSNQDNFDQKNINEDWKDQEDEEFQQNLLSLRRNSIQQQFNGYHYDYQLAAMNLNPSLISQSDLAQYIQTQQLPAHLQQQASIKASSTHHQRSMQGEGFTMSGGPPLIPYPKSEALSPKNGRLPLSVSPNYPPQPYHHQRLQSAITKPSPAMSQSVHETKRGETQMDSHHSFYQTPSHHKKTASVSGTALQRLTPQQQQFLSQQLQSLQLQQQQMVQKVNDSLMVSDQSAFIQGSYHKKRTGSRTGTASTKHSAAAAGPVHHARPWSSSVSGGGASSYQTINHGPHSNLMMRKHYAAPSHYSSVGSTTLNHHPSVQYQTVSSQVHNHYHHHQIQEQAKQVLNRGHITASSFYNNQQ